MENMSPMSICIGIIVSLGGQSRVDRPSTEGLQVA